MTISPWVYASLSLLCALVALRLVLAPPDTGRPHLQVALLLSAAAILAALAISGFLSPLHGHKPRNVSDVNTGEPSSDPTVFAASAQRVYFPATTPNGPRLLAATPDQIKAGALTEVGLVPVATATSMAVATRGAEDHVLVTDGRAVHQIMPDGTSQELQNTGGATVSGLLARDDHAVVILQQNNQVQPCRVDWAKGSLVPTGSTVEGSLRRAAIGAGGRAAWIVSNDTGSTLHLIGATGDPSRVTCQQPSSVRFDGTTLWCTVEQNSRPALLRVPEGASTPQHLAVPTDVTAILGSATSNGKTFVLAATGGDTILLAFANNAWSKAIPLQNDEGRPRGLHALPSASGGGVVFLTGNNRCHQFDANVQYSAVESELGKHYVADFFPFGPYGLFLGRTQALGNEPWQWHIE